MWFLLILGFVALTSAGAYLLRKASAAALESGSAHRLEDDGGMRLAQLRLPRAQPAGGVLEDPGVTGGRREMKAIVFDFDGVILESVDIKTRAFRELFKGHPEHLDTIVRFHLDNTGMSRFEKFKIIYREYLGRRLDHAELAFLAEAFSRFLYNEILVCPFVHGAYNFLEARAKQYQLFVASAAPQREIRDIVEQRELAKFFRGVYGSPRTKGEILRGVLVKSHLRPTDVVFIGDTMSDYQAAREVSVPFIGRVPRGKSSPFPDEGAVTTIENLYQLDQQWSFLLERLG